MSCDPYALQLPLRCVLLAGGCRWLLPSASMRSVVAGLVSTRPQEAGRSGWPLPSVSSSLRRTPAPLWVLDSWAQVTPQEEVNVREAGEPLLCPLGMGETLGTSPGAPYLCVRLTVTHGSFDVFIYSQVIEKSRNRP